VPRFRAFVLPGVGPEVVGAAPAWECAGRSPVDEREFVGAGTPARSPAALIRMVRLGSVRSASPGRRFGTRRSALPRVQALFRARTARRARTRRQKRQACNRDGVASGRLARKTNMG